MVFVILCVIVAAVIVWVFMDWLDYNEWLSALGMSFLVGLLAAIFAGIALVLFMLIPANDKLEDGGSSQLQAIGNASAIEGHFYFLGGGYINDRRVLNYIEKSDDGGFMVSQADASSSVIYESDAKPTVSYTYHSYSNGWVLPWDVRLGVTYRFDIPAGSVLENYTIDNG